MQAGWSSAYVVLEAASCIEVATFHSTTAVAVVRVVVSLARVVGRLLLRGADMLKPMSLNGMHVLILSLPYRQAVLKQLGQADMNQTHNMKDRLMVRGVEDGMG